MESASRAAPPSSRALYPLLLALLTTALAAACWWQPRLLDLIGIGHGGLWFRDTFAVLVATEAHRAGVDPFAATGAFGQHNYSHWWFWLEATGVTRRHTLFLGLIVCGIGLLAGWLVTRPRSPSELAWALAIFCSAPVLLGFDRANVDLLLFALLALLPGALLSRNRIVRVVGAPALIALATGLKYYPIATVPLLLAIRPGRDRRLAFLVAALLLGLTFASVAPDLVRYHGVVERPGFYVLGVPLWAALSGLPGGFVAGTAAAAIAAAGVGLNRGPAREEVPTAPGRQREYLAFIACAAVLTFCFLGTVNYAYRWIFALGLMPYLCRVPSASPTWRRRAALTRWLLLGQLWLEAPLILALNIFPQPEATVRGCERFAQIVLAVSGAVLFAVLAGWLAQFALAAWRGADAAQPGG